MCHQQDGGQGRWSRIKVDNKVMEKSGVTVGLFLGGLGKCDLNVDKGMETPKKAPLLNLA